MAGKVTQLSSAHETKGVTQEKFLESVSDIRNAQQRYNDAQSGTGNAWKSAEKRGVNKGALKAALQIDGMEQDKQQIFLRDLRQYLAWLEIKEQGDMLAGVTDKSDAPAKEAVQKAATH